MELRGHDVAALDDAHEPLAVLARAHHIGGVRRAAGERVHVVEGRGLAEALGQAPIRARTSRGSSRCAAAAGSRARSRSRAGSRGLRAPSCSLEDSNSSCIPRQIPSSGTPAAARSISASPRPVRSRLRIASGNAPTPGRMIALASRDVCGHDRLGADVRQRLLDAAPVAHPVVGDRDHVSVPLVDGNAGLLGIDRDRHAQRPRERLEARLDHVVRVRAGLQVDVQRQPRGAGDGAEELLGDLVLEAVDVRRRAAARSR